MNKEHVLELATKKTIIFTKDEIDEAEREMRRSRTIVSSIQKNDIAVGLTANKTGMQYFSAYYKGFYLGRLSDEGQTFVFDLLQIPAWLLDAIGTPLEAEARQTSCALSILWMLDDHEYALAAEPQLLGINEPGLSIDALREKIKRLQTKQ